MAWTRAYNLITYKRAYDIENNEGSDKIVIR